MQILMLKWPAHFSKAFYMKDRVCDELYNSGLYTDLATWSSWTDGDCSETDCKMTQQRTCSQGADCIGSHNRTVSCTSPCVPDQGRRMDEAFKEMMVAHC